MKRTDNRQNKLHQFGFKRTKDKSVQIKRNKRGCHLIHSAISKPRPLGRGKTTPLSINPEQISV